MLYSGASDNLDLKLQMFNDLCSKAELPQTPEAFGQAFSTMLKGDARDYYYDSISGRGLTFDAMVLQTREHFETAERRQHLLSLWNITSLRSTMKLNKNKSIAESFEIMFRELQRVQRGLGDEY
ncbi:hypothetical protein GcM3_035035, partial [Golovinomyces cichoracearum]